jgi:hypothetical protein
MIDHCKVPDETTEMVINVELVSPESRQPALVPYGGVEGFEILFDDVKSTIFVAGLFGCIPNEGVVQPGTAPLQLLAV